MSLAGADLLAAAAGLTGLVLAARQGMRVLLRRRLVRLAERVTGTHARVLRVKQKQLVVHDGYGNHDLAGWIEHVNYFIDAVVLREARAAGLLIDSTEPGSPLRDRLIRAVLRVVNATDIAGPGPDEPSAAARGRDYEARCQALLEAAGWQVAATPASGDQGADLVARRAGVTLVIQCKCHAQPVGNKAVQEAAAARAVHAGDHAAVVSASGFTRGARDLAAANGVLLLHHDLLADLDAVLAGPPGLSGPGADRRPGR